jgi:hypothetical protein
MKTTVVISDSLLRKAKRVAAREGTTVRWLIEQGLRHAVGQRQRARPFRLRKASFKGKGLSAEAKGLGWDCLRNLAYAAK